MQFGEVTEDPALREFLTIGAAVLACFIVALTTSRLSGWTSDTALWMTWTLALLVGVWREVRAGRHEPTAEREGWSAGRWLGLAAILAVVMALTAFVIRPRFGEAAAWSVILPTAAVVLFLLPRRRSPA